MKKIAAVEEARAIMTLGMQWGVWKWLVEKKTVPPIADQARTALDDAEMNVKLTWSDDFKLAYNQPVSQNAEPARGRGKTRSPAPATGNHVDQKALTAAARVK